MSLGRGYLGAVLATAMAVAPSFAQEPAKAAPQGAKEPVRIAQNFAPAAKVDVKLPYERSADGKAQDFSMENGGRKGVGVVLRHGASVDPAKLEELKSLITSNLKDAGAPSQIFTGPLNNPKGVTLAAYVNGDEYADASDGQMTFNTRGFGLNIERIAAQYKAVLAKPSPTTTLSSLNRD